MFFFCLLFFWLLVYRFLFLVVFAQNFFFSPHRKFFRWWWWLSVYSRHHHHRYRCLFGDRRNRPKKNEFWKIFTIFFLNPESENQRIFHFFCFACHQCFWMVIFRRRRCRCIIVSRPFTPNHHHHIIHMMMIIASITTKKHHSQNGKNKIQKTYQAYRQPVRERERPWPENNNNNKIGNKKKPRKFFGNKKISRMFKREKIEKTDFFSYKNY